MSKIAELPIMSKSSTSSTRDRLTISVGIIGMGDMGKMYARRLSEAGWKYVPGFNLPLQMLCFRVPWFIILTVFRVNACDRDDKFEALKEEYKGRKSRPQSTICTALS